LKEISNKGIERKFSTKLTVLLFFGISTMQIY